MCSQASVCSNVCSQILLDHDAEVNAASDFGETPLFRAVIYGRLITAQASSNVLLRFSASALHRYSSSTERMSARPTTLGTLLCFWQPNMDTLSWSRLVTHSLVTSLAQTVGCQILLEHGGNVNTANDYGQTPLHYAVDEDVEMVKVDCAFISLAH